MSPAALTSLLLDTLLSAVQEYLSMVDMVTSDALMRVFARSAEPVWGMVRGWLERGMPVRELAGGIGMGRRGVLGGALDEEFFVEDNEIGLVDPDFWAHGFELREGTGLVDEVNNNDNWDRGGPKTVPVFLAHIAADVLGSGKATGLLRALGIPDSETDADIGRPFMNESFGDLLAQHTSLQKDTSMSLSTDALSRVVYDELLPHCQATGAVLTDVLVDECDLWKHLQVIEGLYLMRKGDSMSHFTDVLFAKVCLSFIVCFLLYEFIVNRWTVSNSGVTFISSIVPLATFSTQVEQSG